MSRGFRPLIVLLAPLLAACNQPPLPQDTFYRLQVDLPGVAAATPRLNGTLEVERFVADGLTAGRPIVYSRSDRPHELQEYHYHFWTEPPPIMLRDQLIAYLRASRVATAVVTPELRVAADYVLAGKITRLERVVGAAPRAVVELELGVRETDNDRLLFVDTYRDEEAASGDSVGAAVAALNVALARIYARFAADLKKM